MYACHLRLATPSFLNQTIQATTSLFMSLPVCHVVHLVYRFDTGGLENVVVQLINKLPQTEFRHTVVAITEVAPIFAQRILRPDVEVISLGKLAGQPFWLYPKVYRLLRRLGPDVLHTCNLAALEFAPMAALAGVPLRVHAEHGWDIGELGGKATRYVMLRKFFKHFVNEFVAVSAPLYDYLKTSIDIAPSHLHLIPNGVDTGLFRPRRLDEPLPDEFPFKSGQHWVVGMVGRMVPIKNPMLLVEAFLKLVTSISPGTEHMRLVMVGDGPLCEHIRQRMTDAGHENRLWLPGARADIAIVLRAMDCFVLPSLSEGTSCTLQEAMASGLSIVATDVGGNADLLEHGRCGSLVPSGDASALAAAILQHHDVGLQNSQITAAVAAVQERYGLPAVVDRYRELFLSFRKN